MRGGEAGIRGVISPVVRAVRREAVLAAAGVLLVAVPALLLVAWGVGGVQPWGERSAGPLLLDMAVTGVVVLGALFVRRRWVAPVDEVGVAAAAEERLGMPAGSLRGVLELGRGLPPGASAALAALAEAEVGARLAGVTGPRELAGAVGERTRRRLWVALATLMAATSLVALAGFGAPERSRAAWAPLLNPVAYLAGPALPALVVEPGDAMVERGGALEVRIAAEGRQEVFVVWRMPGEVPRKRAVEVRHGRASTWLEGIDAPLEYEVEAPDGARSGVYRVTPVDPLLLAGLVIELRYPAYLGQPAERLQGEIPALEVPAGTELRVQGRSTRALEGAVLVERERGDTIRFAVDGAGFGGRWVPKRGGRYDWLLRGRGGREAVAASLELAVVADEPPEVRIVFPGTDTLLGPDMRQVIEAEARDDHGLRSAAIVSWRVSALGGQDAPVEVPVPAEGVAERSLLRTVLEAGDRRLLPGDTIRYFMRVVDNSPGGQTAVSRTYSLRVPGLTELRELARREAESLVAEAGALSRSAQQLQQSTRDLGRRARPGTPGRPDRGGPAARGGESASRERVEYSEVERGRQVLEQQQQMLERVEGMRQRVEELERAMALAGLKDPALHERLAELRELYEKVLTPELKKQMQELARSLEQLDPEQMKQALEQLAKQQEEFRQRMEESLALLRRAAAEQRMNELAQQARELAEQQKALAEAMKREGRPDAARAEQQRDLSARADSLRAAVDSLRQKLAEQGETAGLEKTQAASEQARAALEAAQQAAREASRAQGEKAAEKGEEAARELDRTAETLASARQEMAEAWKQETQQAMQQATQDALALAQRQAALAERMRQVRDGEQSGTPQAQQPQAPQPGQEGASPEAGQQSQQGQQSGQGQQGQRAQQQEGGRSAGLPQNGESAGQQGEQGSEAKKGGTGGNTQDGQGSSGEKGGPGGSAGELQALRAEQAALRQGLETLGRNLSEAARRSALVDRQVGAALGRAMLEMQETIEAMETRPGVDGLPVDQARETVDALNRLALALLANGEQIAQSESGTGMQEALKQLADLARQQGSLNGRSSSLMPLQLAPQSMGEQVAELARQQREIAQSLQGLNNQLGGREDVLGRLDDLVREAESISRELSGGRLTPELLARQERLFHRLLDAGRTLEKDEYSDERLAERPQGVAPSRAAPLDPALLEAGPRFRIDPEQLNALPPAYRRLILEYFDRLNAAEAARRSRRVEPAPAATEAR